MAAISTRIRCMTEDYDDIKNCEELMKCIEVEIVSDLHWKIRVHGRSGSYWSGMVYDLDMEFSRRHPLEPPVVSFNYVQVHTHIYWADYVV